MSRRSRSGYEETFYTEALEAGDRDLLAEARAVEGLDDEVALLRLEIRRLVEQQEADPRVLQAGMRLLIQAVAVRHRLSGRQSEHLGDAAAQLIEQFGALFASIDGADAGTPPGVEGGAG